MSEVHVPVDCQPLPGPAVKNQPVDEPSLEKLSPEERLAYKMMGLPLDQLFYLKDEYRSPESFRSHPFVSIFHRGRSACDVDDSESFERFFAEFLPRFWRKNGQLFVINCYPSFEKKGWEFIYHLISEMVMGYAKLPPSERDALARTRGFKWHSTADFNNAKPYWGVMRNHFLAWGPITAQCSDTEYVRAQRFMHAMKPFNRVILTQVSDVERVFDRLGFSTGIVDYAFNLFPEPEEFEKMPTTRASSKPASPSNARTEKKEHKAVEL